jgi:hypothetical protein
VKIMAYGTSNGVSNNLIDYEELIGQTAISEEMVGECRTSADGMIDARLAPVAPAGGLPLVSPPAIVNCISDDLTTYFILRRLFTGKDPNDSAWVDKFYTRPLEMLEQLVKSPRILDAPSGAVNAASGASSTTLNQDRIFSVSRTSGGSLVSGDGEGGMDDW